MPVNPDNRLLEGVRGVGIPKIRPGMERALF